MRCFVYAEITDVARGTVDSCRIAAFCAVRGALGANRGRIVRQVLMESFVLSSAGAALGLGFASVLIAWLAHQGSVALPLLSMLRIDSRALGWTILIAMFTTMLFGLLPGYR